MALVQFWRKESADAVIHQLDRAEFHGRTLNVVYSRQTGDPPPRESRDRPRRRSPPRGDPYGYPPPYPPYPYRYPEPYGDYDRYRRTYYAYGPPPPPGAPDYTDRRY
jgi:hypothetical protein